MKNKIVIGSFVCIIAALLIFFALRSPNVLVLHPKGLIAHKQLKLIITNVLLMLIVIVPTTFFLLHTVWKARAKHKSEKKQVFFKEWILWVIPAVVVCVMAIVTFFATHELDPYKPIVSDTKPIKIQVISMDWKWLFIYPEEGIATLNFVQFPEKTPIHFTLAADGSPMNSFWIPELSGQIYSMTGMITPLHIMADGVGEFRGRAAEINGEGFADMAFMAKSTTQSDYEAWVTSVKQSPIQLTIQNYEALLTPSINLPVTHYSDVEPNLFDDVVMKYMHPAHHG